MSARGSSEHSQHQSTSSSIYANHRGLHLHKLSSSNPVPSPDFISTSTHSTQVPSSIGKPPTNGQMKGSLPNVMDSIYLNFQQQKSPGVEPGRYPQSPQYSVGNGYASMEEKYAVEMRKLFHEMDSYRSTISQMNAKHEDYNHLIQIFDGKLALMVRHVEKLQQKSQLKQGEIDKLRQEIEHLRLMSCHAGVNLPPTRNNGGIGLPAQQHQDGAVEQLSQLTRRPSSPSESVVSHRSAMSTTSKISNGTVNRITKLNLNGFGSGQANGDSSKEGSVNGSAKKSWIRSSFNKAFHKAAGGGNGKKQKLSAPTNGSVSDIEHSPIHTARSSAGRVNGGTSIGSGSTSRLEEVGGDHRLIPMIHVVELKKQLEDKDLALTDVRLDALDKAREVDILRETVHRLKNENKILKHNFTVLERRMRDDSRASSHQSLSTCCQDESEQQPFDMPGGSCTGSGSASVKGSTSGFTPGLSIAESRCHSASSSSKRSSGGMNIRVTLCVDLSGRLDFSLQSTSNPPQSSNHHTHSIAHSANVGGSSSTISSTASFASSHSSNTNKRELTIGYLGVPAVTSTWEDTDQQLGSLLNIKSC